MKPYYEDDFVTLYHGDCLEISEWWAHADVLVTDPPYGMKYVSNSSWKAPTDAIAGDNDTSARDAVLDKWGSRPALVFGTWRVPRPPQTRMLIVWDKGDSPGMGDLTMPWGPSHEEIYVLGRGFSGKRRGAVYRVNTLSAGNPDRPAHPTPKPIELMEQLLAHTPGVVADPFAGSGSTLVAAKRLGRRAIGVELEEKYCEIAARRLSQDVLDLEGLTA